MTLVFTLGLNIMYNEQKAIMCFMVLVTVAFSSQALNVQFLLTLQGTGLNLPFDLLGKYWDYSRMQWPRWRPLVIKSHTCYELRNFWKSFFVLNKNRKKILLWCVCGREDQIRHLALDFLNENKTSCINPSLLNLHSICSAHLHAFAFFS